MLLRRRKIATTGLEVVSMIPESTGVELKEKKFDLDFWGELAAWLLAVGGALIYAVIHNVSQRGIFFGYHLFGVALAVAVFAVSGICWGVFWYGEGFFRELRRYVREMLQIFRG